MKLLNARYVKPYRQRNKTDRNDCDAILEASRSAKIKPVPVQGIAQQQIQQLHRLREMWKHNRNQRINVLRGVFRELGINAPVKTEAFIHAASHLLEAPELKAIASSLHIVLAEITQHGLWIDECEQQLKTLLSEDEALKRIDEVIGIGILTGSALMAAVVTPERFKNGRVLSAWLGITPRENSSGSTRKLGSITREGNRYVRTLLIHGARAALLAAKRCASRTPEKLTALQRWAIQTADRVGHNKATVALANKMVRICWALWCHQRRFDSNYALQLQAAHGNV